MRELDRKQWELAGGVGAVLCMLTLGVGAGDVAHTPPAMPETVTITSAPAIELAPRLPPLMPGAWRQLAGQEAQQAGLRKMVAVPGFSGVHGSTAVG